MIAFRFSVDDCGVAPNFPVVTTRIKFSCHTISTLLCTNSGLVMWIIIYVEPCGQLELLIVLFLLGRGIIHEIDFHLLLKSNLGRVWRGSHGVKLQFHSGIM
jgi:hypothetical protein